MFQTALLFFHRKNQARQYPKNRKNCCGRQVAAVSNFFCCCAKIRLSKLCIDTLRLDGAYRVDRLLKWRTTREAIHIHGGEAESAVYETEQCL